MDQQIRVVVEERGFECEVVEARCSGILLTRNEISSSKLGRQASQDASSRGLPRFVDDAPLVAKI
jgi:hypothetical protein